MMEKERVPAQAGGYQCERVTAGQLIPLSYGSHNKHHMGSLGWRAQIKPELLAL